MNEIEEKIRNLRIPQLEVLQMLAESKDGVSSSKEIGDTTHTSSFALGALLTPIRRIKTGIGDLIIPAGRQVDGSVRWQINEKVITRDNLKILLGQMSI